MTSVIFNGPDDFRELAAADLAKAGVEGFRAKSFAKGETVEVADDVAQALTAEGSIFGNFSVEGEASKFNPNLEVVTTDDKGVDGAAATGLGDGNGVAPTGPAGNQTPAGNGASTSGSTKAGRA